MVQLYHEYKPEHHRFRGHIRILLLMALLLLLIALTFAISIGMNNPWYWGAAGFALSLAGLVWGTSAMDPMSTSITPLGRFLANHREQWYPDFLILTQNLLTVGFCTLFWFTVTDFFFPATAFLNTLFISLCLVFPIHRLLKARLLASSSHLPTVPGECVGFLYSIILTLFILYSLALMITSNQSSGGAPASSIMIWVPGIVLMTFQLILFIHSLIQIRKQADE